MAQSYRNNKIYQIYGQHKYVIDDISMFPFCNLFKSKLTVRGWGGSSMQLRVRSPVKSNTKITWILKQFHYLDLCDLGNWFALWGLSEIKFLLQTKCWLQGSLQRRHIPSLGKVRRFNMQPELDEAKAGALCWRNETGGDDDLCLERLNVFFQT